MRGADSVGAGAREQQHMQARILLADGDDMQPRRLCPLLERAGFDVTVCGQRLRLVDLVPQVTSDLGLVVEGEYGGADVLAAVSGVDGVVPLA